VTPPRTKDSRFLRVQDVRQRYWVSPYVPDPSTCPMGSGLARDVAPALCFVRGQTAQAPVTGKVAGPLTRNRQPIYWL
jgi:hypothetical protein